MESQTGGRAFVKEVILENFLSYDYGRVLLKPGLNVVMGPNGAGKSSILLAISVALGQASTERSRRLSDLVKRGKDIARVTLLLDNSPVGGKRPLPYRADVIHLSRYIRKDGTYWFEIDFKEADKQAVVETLGRLGLNPDNMLIMMHQGLGDIFSVIRPEEKLSLVEDAAGIASYRASLLEARARLESIATEEDEKKKELESAKTTLARWQDNYEKSVKIRGLREELTRLRIEEAWCRVSKEEEKIASLEERIKEAVANIEDMTLKLADGQRDAADRSKDIEVSLGNLLKGEKNLSRLRAELAVIRHDSSTYGALKAALQDSPEGVAKAVEGSLLGDEGRGRTLEEEASSIERNLGAETPKLLEKVEGFAVAREKAAVLDYRLKEKKKELKSLEGQKAASQGELAEAKSSAEMVGRRVPTPRVLSDVQLAIKVDEAQLVQLGDIPQEAEEIYRDFQNRIGELSGKLEKLKDNKEATMKEVSDRFKVWRKQLDELATDVNESYGRMLSLIGAAGRVRITGEDDPLKAGIELQVAFRGQDLVPLDSYTQSGGERSSAVTAFLLALQQHILSPFRAVDEFDVHMDPSSRETFIKALHDYFRKDRSVQYLVITPGTPAFYDESAHYIMVQKVAAASQIKVAKGVGQGE
ncbi:MAG TPA: AAA family ATPase [Conexivisphaerales archaeon]|nr:AAA family ATPase [Conexivisphaerales archaeon]